MSQFPAPQFSVSDFTAAYLSLMPTGKVWPRDTDAVIAQTIACLAPTYARQTQDLANLLADAFPSNPVNLLPEWESTLGLPNPYAGSQTVPQRQAQVLQKFANDGGQSVAYFLSVIASLGFTGASITEYTPFCANVGVANSPLCGQPWAFAWKIIAPTISVQYFETNFSTSNEALFTLVGASELEYVIDQYAPAHTIPLFAIA
jgi:uncharacterized protein YmfQ (DUF2313 family)